MRDPQTELETIYDAWESGIERYDQAADFYATVDHGAKLAYDEALRESKEGSVAAREADARIKCAELLGGAAQAKADLDKARRYLESLSARGDLIRTRIASERQAT